MAVVVGGLVVVGGVVVVVVRTWLIVSISHTWQYCSRFSMTDGTASWQMVTAVSRQLNGELEGIYAAEVE